MPRSMILLLTLATLSVGVHAQSTDGAGSSTNTQAQAAPIERAYPAQNSAASAYANPQANPAYPPADAPMRPARTISSSQPIAGVWVRTDANSAVQTVSADAKGTELRVTHGIANVSVHHPEHDARILVDLPGGQVALLKDGMYTLNADTNVVRVLKGEADAYPGSAVDGIKVKEEHQLALGKDNRATEVAPGELMADYLPGRNDDARGSEGYAGAGYGYGPYGDGFYGYPYPYPYVAYGYGYPWGYGWGYPYGVGLGFGYYGGFGGFRGGFGGFRGRR
jgi:hypothetical protein